MAPGMDASALPPGSGFQRVLDLARVHLEMDLTFLSEFSDERQVMRAVSGDAASFGIALDRGLAMSQGFCHHMMSGAIPHAVPDTAAHPLLKNHSGTTIGKVGAYVGVPVRLDDGTVYGSLCAISHTRRGVDGKDVKFLRLLADLVTLEVQGERDADRARDRLHQVVSGHELQIALQPVVDLESGTMQGVEALSRFPDDLGPPELVYAHAHTLGMGAELEQYAVSEALRALPLLDPGEYLAVNLTPAVAVALATKAPFHDLPFDRIVLEITEHAAVESYAELRDSLADVRREGLRLAIDDAGAGYASLHHVVELAPDLIKIDRSLIGGIAGDPARRSVVRAFASLAADLGAGLVAEGLETRDDLAAIRDLGVGAAQGFLLARPSTERDDLPRWHATRLTPGDAAA